MGQIRIDIEDYCQEEQANHVAFRKLLEEQEDFKFVAQEAGEPDALLVFADEQWEEVSVNDKEQERIRSALQEGRVVVLIGTAPLLMAKQGLLKNKHATANKSDGDSELERKMLEFGTFYDASQPIVQDENLISAQDDEETLQSLAKVLPVFLRQQKDQDSE